VFLTQKHFDVLNKSLGITGLWKKAIILGPMIRRERLGGSQHDLNFGILGSNRASEFYPVHRAGHSDIAKIVAQAGYLINRGPHSR